MPPAMPEAMCAFAEPAWDAPDDWVDWKRQLGILGARAARAVRGAARAMDREPNMVGIRRIGDGRVALTDGLSGTDGGGNWDKSVVAVVSWSLQAAPGLTRWRFEKVKVNVWAWIGLLLGLWFGRASVLAWRRSKHQ